MDVVKVLVSILVGVEELYDVDLATMVVSLVTNAAVVELVEELEFEAVDVGKVVDNGLIDEMDVVLLELVGVAPEEPVELGSVVAVIELAVSLVMDPVVLELDGEVGLKVVDVGKVVDPVVVDKINREVPELVGDVVLTDKAVELSSVVAIELAVSLVMDPVVEVDEVVYPNVVDVAKVLSPASLGFTLVDETVKLRIVV